MNMHKHTCIYLMIFYVPNDLHSSLINTQIQIQQNSA